MAERSPQPAATPSSRWAAKGDPDPHGTQYDCERAALAHGDMTDDELANAVFMYCHGVRIEHLGFPTAAKDRIRWLSRRLAAVEKDAKDAARYRFLRQPGNAIVYAKDVATWNGPHSGSGHFRYETPEQLDAGIDAAVAAQEAARG